jgi:hypothetical protein
MEARRRILTPSMKFFNFSMEELDDVDEADAEEATDLTEGFCL